MASKKKKADSSSGSEEDDIKVFIKWIRFLFGVAFINCYSVNNPV